MLDLVAIPPGHNPADAVSGSKRLAERAAQHHLPSPIEGLRDLGSIRREGQLAVNVVLNQRDVPPGENLHQARFLRVGHATAERVAVVEHEETRFDAAAIQAFLQFVQADAVSGKSRNLARLETERSDDLHYAEVGRRFDGDGIARSGDGSQGQVERFLATTRGHNVIGSSDLDAQLMGARSDVIAVGQLRGPTSYRRHRAAQLPGRQQELTRQSRAEAHQGRVARRLHEPHHEIAGAHPRGAQCRFGLLRFGRRLPKPRLYVIPGLRSRLDQTLVLQNPVSLHDRGDADLLLFA